MSTLCAFDTVDQLYILLCITVTENNDYFLVIFRENVQIIMIVFLSIERSVKLIVMFRSLHPLVCQC